MALFANVELDNEGQINSHNNFREFGSAMMVLFRCSTGESWQEIMYVARLTTPHMYLCSGAVDFAEVQNFLSVCEERAMGMLF